MRTLASRVVRENRGQDLIEYALLAAFVSLAATLSLSALGAGIQAWYSSLAASIASF